MIAMAPVTFGDLIPFIILFALFMPILIREKAWPAALGGLLGTFSGFSLSVLCRVVSYDVGADWAICGLIVGVLLGFVLQRVSSASPPKRSLEDEAAPSKLERNTGTAIQEGTPTP
jgi:hypothetical protein